MTRAHLTAYFGLRRAILALFKNGQHPDLKDTEYGRTPLSWATGRGHEAVVKLLLEKGVDMKFKDWCGWTPLWRAAENGHEAVVKLLLGKGTNVELRNGKKERLIFDKLTKRAPCVAGRATTCWEAHCEGR
jgi:ankyrin repeat protein